MRWRRFILAVGCGGAVSGGVTAVVHTLRVFDYSIDLAAWLTPQPLPDRVYWLLADVLVGVALAVPGAAVAVWVAMRTPGDGHTRCRKCGYILRGLTEPRCPECGTAI